jgi:heat shock protein HtpX
VLGSYGLQTYIWNNRLKSILLLAGFPVLLLLISFGFALIISALNDPDVATGIADAVAMLPALVPVAVGGALIWFVIAWFANQTIIDAVTGAHEVSRAEEPRVWNILETLCISRGITMPKLRVIETEARNAFASGVHTRAYSITVTRGLIDALNDAELEAVLGHELTHIENRDVQLMVVSAVFVGIISLAADIIIRSPRAFLWSAGGRSSGSRRSSGKGGGGGAVILILIAIAIFILARVLAVALNFAVSRKREFLADAGSVELTKDPDAMISALEKVSGHSEIHAPAQVQEMFLDHPRAAGLGGLFATHPPIQARIDALVRYAGGHEVDESTGNAAASRSAAPTQAPDRQGAANPAEPPKIAPHEFGRRQHPPSSVPDVDNGPPPAGPWTDPRN